MELPWPFKKKNYIKAIIVYPNKNVVLKKITTDKPTFSQGEGSDLRTYAIDQKSIYYFNKDPLLFYLSSKSAPLLITDEGIESGMNSKEFTSIIETKVVRDLLVASSGLDLNWTLILCAVNTLGLIGIGMKLFGVF